MGDLYKFAVDAETLCFRAEALATRPWGLGKELESLAFGLEVQRSARSATMGLNPHQLDDSGV